MLCPSDINVLVACEFSQEVCQAFFARGFNAFSCDLVKTMRRGNPSRHIIADCVPFLSGRTDFTTADGVQHNVPRWHLIIAHPPCTYLCKLSAVHLRKGGYVQVGRWAKMCAARRFFLRCLNASVPYVAVENPIPLAVANLPRPTDIIDPPQFGDKYTKRTCLWLRNLPPLLPTCVPLPSPSLVASRRGRYRAVTQPHFASQMALQWGDYIINDLNKQKHITL